MFIEVPESVSDALKLLNCTPVWLLNAPFSDRALKGDLCFDLDIALDGLF